MKACLFKKECSESGNWLRIAMVDHIGLSSKSFSNFSFIPCGTFCISCVDASFGVVGISRKETTEHSRQKERRSFPYCCHELIYNSTIEIYFFCDDEESVLVQSKSPGKKQVRKKELTFFKFFAEKASRLAVQHKSKH